MSGMEWKNIYRICQGRGWRYNSHSNLCISDFPAFVYFITLDKECAIKKVDLDTKYLVVACDTIENVCLPVRLYSYQDNEPNRQNSRCLNGAFRDDL